ncbi:hypothetical protein [Rhizobium sp. Leaf306]|uniref:hypothetical protein n=1 Tax=Rhizobium sp. Leaf306 TaxID=1736330 RepID=UPI000A8AAD52|nr:hypothetical protein [Rhizobium sp. Leaf306]
MNTITITTEVQLQEAKAMIDHLSQRNLFLAQSLKQSFQIGFNYEKEIAELKARLEAADRPATVGESE